MPEDLAPDVAQTSPEPEESSTPAIEQTVVAEDQDSPPETAEPKRSLRAEERIAELVAEKTAAKEAAEFWRLEATKQKPQVSAVAEPQPTLEQFDHDQDKWADAFSKWSINQAGRVADEKVATAIESQRLANENSAVKAKWEEKSGEFAETHPDFDSIVHNPTIRINQDMVKVFMQSDKGPELAYHLGKNPDIAVRISRMPPAKMALALGRLESELTSKPQPTKAPTPPNPVGGQQPTADQADMGVNEWVAWRRDQLRQAGRR